MTSIAPINGAKGDAYIYAIEPEIWGYWPIKIYNAASGKLVGQIGRFETRNKAERHIIKAMRPFDYCIGMLGKGNLFARKSTTRGQTND